MNLEKTAPFYKNELNCNTNQNWKVVFNKKQMLKDIIENNQNYQPGLSIDCVIFGFHDNQLKVLLIKVQHSQKWSLPGGFIPIDQDIDTAAITVLNERTGVEGVFLRQFATFGKTKRNDQHFGKEVLEYLKIEEAKGKWLTQRFVTIGYYALVDFLKTIPKSVNNEQIIEWIDHKEVPELILDHKEILDKALDTLRIELNLMPVGYNLLPEKFTIPELQKLYETILDRKLDRRNFLRKITNIGILTKLDEKKSNVAHKAPNLYSFDKDKYEEVLKNGLNQGW
ncbi:NUDIX domain-containing protein [Flavobacterium sp. 90]|uniref:NUDIX hydrolase n=1 Tax=unclassified Flavobacterium TaxID=196869 RepID=UPI0032603A6C